MKKFISYLLALLAFTIVLAFVLDLIFSNVYSTAKPRNKVQAIMTSKKQNYDVVILGSSRANNHFVPEIFNNLGLTTFNYGMSGGHLFEASLMLKIMLERGYNIKTVLLEADLNLSSEEPAEGISALFLPFLHSSEVIEEHFKKQDNFPALYYVPFYRYSKFDGKIGFRELVKTIKGEKTNTLENSGYYPLEKTKNANMKNNIINLKPKLKNTYYEEIKGLCEDNNIKFIAVMTPMCDNTKGLEYFEKVQDLYPEILNYEKAVQGDQFFSSCGHLNNAGARLLTTKVVQDLF